MWGKLAGVLFEKIIGGLIKMWESNKRDAANIEKGADIVTKETLKDETEKAKESIVVSEKVSEMSDDDLDAKMRELRAKRRAERKERKEG